MSKHSKASHQSAPHGHHSLLKTCQRAALSMWYDITDFAHTRFGLPLLICGAAAFCVLVGSIIYLAVQPGQVLASSAAAESSALSQAAEDADYDAKENVIDTAQYTDTVLGKSEDAGQDYVDGTLFIGDSNSYRYMCYGFTSLDNDIAVVGMGAGQLATLKCVRFKKSSSGYVTIPNALKIMQPQRVIFGYGTNNLTGDMDAYIKTYAEGIQACYDAYPYFDIIVNAIPPVDQQRDYPAVTMQNVDKFNAALAEMCKENGWKFLNSSEALKDESTGFAKANYTLGDGLHLSKEGCTALFDYIQTHSYLMNDRRPQPLKAIPKRDETPPDLITSDPLKKPGSTASSKVNVTFTCTEGGTLSGKTEQSVAPGKTCSEVTAIPSEGYTFAGWSSAYGSSAATTIAFTVPDGAADFGGIVITANFTATGEVPTPTPDPATTPDPAATPTPTPDLPATPTLTPTPTSAPTSDPAATPTSAPTSAPTSELPTEPVVTAAPPEFVPSVTETPPAYVPPSNVPVITATPIPTMAPIQTPTRAPNSEVTPVPAETPTQAPPEGSATEEAALEEAQATATMTVTPDMVSAAPQNIGDAENGE